MWEQVPCYSFAYLLSLRTKISTLKAIVSGVQKSLKAISTLVFWQTPLPACHSELLPLKRQIRMIQNWLNAIFF